MTDDVRHAPPLIDKLRAHGKASDSIAWNGQARQLLLWAADAIEAANVALSERAPHSAALAYFVGLAFCEGHFDDDPIKERIRVWLRTEADKIPDDFTIGQVAESILGAPSPACASPKGSDEVWEVYNRTTSTLLATEEDADRFLSSFSPSSGMTKTRRHVLRHFERLDK